MTPPTQIQVTSGLFTARKTTKVLVGVTVLLRFR